MLSTTTEHFVQVIAVVWSLQQVLWQRERLTLVFLAPFIRAHIELILLLCMHGFLIALTNIF